jgi:PAS domain S-box-containing protein
MSNESTHSEESESDGQPLQAAENARPESEIRFRTMFEQSPLSIQLFSRDGHCLEVNGAWEKLWETSRDQLTGYNVLEDEQLAAKGVLPYIKRAFAGTPTAIPPTLYDPAEIGREGRPRWVTAFVYPVNDDEGNIREVALVLEDVTARMEAEEALRSSEERTRYALEAANMGTWNWDISTGEVKWSGNIEKIHGLPPGSFGGTFESYLSDVHPDDRELVTSSIRRSIEEGIGHDIEYRIVRPDNSVHWVAGKGRAIRDDGGNVVGMSGVCMDINKRKQIEESVRAQSEVIETVNRVGHLLSAELDLQRLLQALTDAATELTGARFGSFFYNVINQQGASYMLYTLSGVPIEHFSHFPMPRATEIFGPTFRGEGIIRLDDVRKDPRYGKNSPYYGIPAGHLPVISYLAIPVISRSGEVIGGLFFGHPEPGVFTQRHERIMDGLAAQAAVALDNARLYQESQEASRLKDEFLATVSHELRTPLNAILGWARMLRGGKLDDLTASQAVEIIERNARSQAQLIEDLLDVSRIITGNLRLEIGSVEPVSVINAAIDAVRPTAEAKSVRLQVMLDPWAGAVSGDPDRLQQIIWNLLSNAVKFTPKGGKVQVRLERVESHIEIVVNDTGQGINPEFLPFVFERFRQADSTLTRAHGGLGLGLAIVRHLVEMHGGTVHADSSGEGLGATFTVKLPLRVMRERVGEKADSMAEPLQASQSTDFSSTLFDCPPELHGVRVLVVDDEPDARGLLIAVLSQCDAEVRACASVEEALVEMEEWNPNILVSDIEMPGEDGYSLIRKVRALPIERGGRIPAVALTAHARAEDRMRALSTGFNMHIPKPVKPAELTLIIASFTDRIKKA